MSFADLRKNLELEMSTKWDAPDAVCYENVKFSQPQTAWVMFTVIKGEGEAYGIDGSSKYARDHGLISLQIYVPEFTGTKESMELVDDFLDIFEQKRLTGNIQTEIASVTGLGVTPSGWHQTSVTIPYWRNRHVPG